MAAHPIPDDERVDAALDAGGFEGFDGDDGVEWCAEWEAAAEALPPLTDGDLLAGLSGPAHEADLLLLASIDVRGLSEPRDRIAYVKAVDRVAAFVAALRSDAVVAFAGAEPAGAYLPEVHREQELSVAARISRYSAGKQIETARALETTFPGFKAALRAGEISPGHCTVLVDRTRSVADPVALAAIGRVALPKAKRMTPGEFATACVALVVRFDRDAAARTRRARQERRVSVRALEDGMGFLGLVHDWATISQIEQTVRADGRRLQVARRAAATGEDASQAATAVDTAAEDGSGDPDDSTKADACRADALAARLLGVLGEDEEIAWNPQAPPVAVQVVIDLATLRGEVDNACLLDGAPITADLARHIAGYATAFRRMVTDPVTGHLLDYGRTTYLPGPLRDYVLARDGGCSSPGCTNRASSRLQLDHAQPFPAGPSTPTNTHTRCTTCHQLKTDGYATITDTTPDGSHTWESAWGQTIHIPPRAFLPGRDDPPETPEPPTPQELPPDDPPPF